MTNSGTSGNQFTTWPHFTNKPWFEKITLESSSVSSCKCDCHQLFLSIQSMHCLEYVGEVMATGIFKLGSKLIFPNLYIDLEGSPCSFARAPLPHSSEAALHRRISCGYFTDDIVFLISVEFLSRYGLHTMLRYKDVCQKHVLRAGTSNYSPQYLWDVITFPALHTCFWHIIPHMATICRIPRQQSCRGMCKTVHRSVPEKWIMTKWNFRGIWITMQFLLNETEP